MENDDLIYRYTEQLCANIRDQEDNFLTNQIYQDIQDNKHIYKNVVKFDLSRERIKKLLLLGSQKEKELEWHSKVSQYIKIYMIKQDNFYLNNGDGRCPYFVDDLLRGTFFRDKNEAEQVKNNYTQPDKLKIIEVNIEEVEDE